MPVFPPAGKCTTGKILSLSSVLFLLIFFVFAPASPNAQDRQSLTDSICCTCHADVCEADLGRAYVHLPFQQQQCTVCHVADAETFEAEAGEPAPLQTVVQKKNIRWFEYTVTPAAEAWFFIPDDLAGRGRLIVSASNAMGRSSEKLLKLPPIETLPAKKTDSRAPVIEAVKVIGVYRSVLTSAHIGWTTDKIADSEVRYGIGNLQHSVNQDKLTTDHTIVLQNLQADREYQYVVLSRDVFGNSAISAKGTFTTANLSAAPPVHYEKTDKTAIRLSADFFRNGDVYLVKLTASQPVTLLVGSLTPPEAAKHYSGMDTGQAADAVITGAPGHAPLRNADDIATVVCRKCHAEMFTSGNHAVNTGPAAGMIIPADYTTTSDGHLSCLTCHDPHSADFEHMTVKSRRRELCVGCHKGYDKVPGKRSDPLLMAKQNF